MTSRLSKQVLLRRFLASGFWGLTVVPFLVPAPLTPTPEQWRADSTGKCTPEKHAELQAAVDAACKTAKMKCTNQHDCDTLLTNMALFGKCIAAREKINDTCFEGGNKTHVDELKTLRSGRETCETLIKSKKGCFGGTCPR